MDSKPTPLWWTLQGNIALIDSEENDSENVSIACVMCLEGEDDDDDNADDNDIRSEFSTLLDSSHEKTKSNTDHLRHKESPKAKHK